MLKCGKVEIITEDSVISNSCDLAITKTVSVNGSTPPTSTTVTTPLQAHVGDSVVWTITVSNNSSQGLIPYGTVSIKDVLPSGVTYVSSNTNGAGTFSNNSWSLPFSSLKATLILTTTANTLGPVVNTATIFNFIKCYEDSCYTTPYNDAVSANNQSSAYINVVAVTPPVVTPPVTPQTPAAITTTPTVKAPSTGFGISNTSPVRVLTEFSSIAVVLTILGLSIRRFAKV